MRFALSVCSFAVGALGLAAPFAAGGPLINVNLVVNGDAETGDDSGWTPSGEMVAAASATAGSLGLPIGADLGEFTFHGSLGDPVEFTLQAIDVSPLAASIDAGRISCDLAGLVQSRRLDTLLDVARVRIHFEDDAKKALAFREYQDPTTPSGVYDWSAFAETLDVPPTTRTIRVELNFIRSGGGSTDGFVDNLRVVLRSCEGDLDGDGDIDFADLNILLDDFNDLGADLPGDLDGDADVDFSDLNTLLNVFNTVCG